jgi:hypothetical protein
MKSSPRRLAARVSGRPLVSDVFGERGTATRHFRLICEAVFAPRVVLELFRRGVYRARGGPTALDSQRRHHHLRIPAESESEAIERARRYVEEAGGNVHEIASIVVVGDDSRAGSGYARRRT